MFDIRSIHQTDVDSCYLIVNANWGETVAHRFLSEVSQVWTDMLEPPLYYVATVDGSVVGFGGIIRSWIMFGVWDVTWVNIKKEFQNEGLGKALIEYCLKEILTCNGKVVNLMTKSPDFFNHFGFNVIKDYGDWKLMTLWLGPLEM